MPRNKTTIAPANNALFRVLTAHRIASIVDRMSVYIPSKGVDLTAAKPPVPNVAGARKTATAVRRLALACEKPEDIWPHRDTNGSQTLEKCSTTPNRDNACNEKRMIDAGCGRTIRGRRP